MPNNEIRPGLYLITEETKEVYPQYTIKSRSKGCLIPGADRVIGKEYQLYGITDPAQMLSFTTDGFRPIFFNTKSIDDAKQQMEDLEILDIHPAIVAVRAVIANNKEIIKRYKEAKKRNLR